MIMQRVARYAHTVRYLRPWQVKGCLVERSRRHAALLFLPEPPTGLAGGLHPAVPFPRHDPWNQREALLEGRFSFLHQQRRLGFPPEWHAEEMSLLWQSYLHGFRYLYLLLPEEQSTLCRSWVQACPPGKGAAWHPYATSLRIVNWCKADLRGTDLLESLYAQAAYLCRNLETQVGGYYLLENARALVLASVFFGEQGEAPRWLHRGLELYRRETATQILSDGGHVERSPMLQACLLEGYLDVLNVLPADHPDRPLLLETAIRMSDVLATMTHPGQQLALFNDATRARALPVSVLRTYIEAITHHSPRPLAMLSASGYYAHRGDEVSLIVDGGAVGPDHLLAHAHADIFSFELAIAGNLFVIDSGVFEYDEGPMRTFARSTRAHNTVCVDETDQEERHVRFGVARRSTPHPVSFTRQGPQSCFEGYFDGYGNRLGYGIRHYRRIRVREDQREIEVLDIVSGAGRHLVESLLHLHPDVEVVDGKTHFIVMHGSASCVLKTTAFAKHWEVGWYCPELGLRHPTRVLVLGGETLLPVGLSYRFYY